MTAIRKIGVIGAGNMGSGIAQKIIQEGIPVVMVLEGLSALGRQRPVYKGQ